MRGSRLATRATSTSIPTPPLAAVSDAAHDSPAAPRSWTPTASLRSEQFEARLDQPLLLERIADLHRRPLGLAPRVETSRGEHARAADPVASRRRAEQHRQVAFALGPGEHEPFGGKDAETEHVHERVAAVRVVEHDLAADGRHADRVPIAADPGHDALEEVASAGIVERAEAQRIHERDRTRAHREDVADDAADAGRRTLVRLDRRRMVVTFDAHRDCEAVADVDDSRALTRTDEHPRRLGGKTTEMHARRLVRAVLGPHDGIHRELEVGRLPVQLGDDHIELVVGHAELPVQRFGRRGGHPSRLPTRRLANGPRSAGRTTDARCCGFVHSKK